HNAEVVRDQIASGETRVAVYMKGLQSLQFAVRRVLCICVFPAFRFLRCCCRYASRQLQRSLRRTRAQFLNLNWTGSWLRRSSALTFLRQGILRRTGIAPRRREGSLASVFF